MRYEAAKVSADNAMPCRAFALVKLHRDQHSVSNGKAQAAYLFLDVLRNVLRRLSVCAFTLSIEHLRARH